MLVVLSPAKTLDFETPPATAVASQPRLMPQTSTLIKVLKKQSPARLAELMSISESLASLNHQRFQDFEIPHPEQGVMPALYAFRGDVYRGLECDRWTTKQVRYGDQHLRILSGLYGVLRPLDAMLPYRLEMGTSLSIGKHRNLYEFWGDQISQLIAADLRATKSRLLLNLASKEYFKSVHDRTLDCEVVAPAFKEITDGKARMVTVYAKVARGTMASWVIRKRIRSLDKLKDFDEDGYRYSEDHSQSGVPTFVRSSTST